MVNVGKIFFACITAVFWLDAINDPLFKYMPDRKILQLYQLMKDVHEVCEKFNIHYWVDSGTLLGALRHQGIIPWDNDVDICVLTTEEKLLKSIKPAMRRLGYRFDYERDIGYRVSTRGAQLDIYMTEMVDDKIYYQREYMRKNFGYNKRGRGPLYYTKDELYPLQKYKFGEIYVWGPYNPTPYLNAYYGDNWYDTARMCTNHNDNIYSPKEIKLKDADRIPALPTGPLKDRVSKPSINKKGR